MNIRHVALIMDGNGRWARQKGLPRIEGHRQGVKKVNEAIDTAIELGLQAVTFYTFSTENWKRPSTEVKALMRLLATYLKSEMQRLHSMNIVFRAVGDTRKLPQNVQDLLHDFEKLTRNNTGLILASALNYGSRLEILHALKQIVRDNVPAKDIDEKLFSSYLYTNGIPDPDLIVRTSGEMRLSNFLLWQAAYSEFYFTETLWPDFGREEFISAVREFEGRERRFGALSTRATG
ncbi:MAG: isoprenyl transferase [Nitrospiraceae bacterium]|nr:MAG: isoprenyl transferase [Nitrospiraceae bacterium]